jgi:hypothetical protein
VLACQQIGYVHAMDLLLTARLIVAGEAARLGLVNRLVPRSDLMGWAIETAEIIAANSPSAVQAVKAWEAWFDDLRCKGVGVLTSVSKIQDFFKARVTPPSVRTIDVASLQPRGSSNIRAAEITPIRGTSSMPVEAIAGGK